MKERKKSENLYPLACSFTNVFPIRFKHAALALRSKYKRGEAGLRHIPQDGGHRSDSPIMNSSAR